MPVDGHVVRPGASGAILLNSRPLRSALLLFVLALLGFLSWRNLTLQQNERHATLAALRVLERQRSLVSQMAALAAQVIASRDAASRLGACQEFAALVTRFESGQLDLISCERHRAPSGAGGGLGRSLRLPTRLDFATGSENYLRHLRTLVGGGPAVFTPDNPALQAILGRSIEPELSALESSLARHDQELRITLFKWSVLHATAWALALVSLGWALVRILGRRSRRQNAEFLACVGHEVRTPLHGILGLATLLDNTRLTAQQRYFLRLIRTTAESSLKPVGDLLDHGRLATGRLAVESIEFDLAVMVEECTGRLADRIQNKDLELASFIAPDVPARVRGDPDRLAQVLTNLLTNAVKFTRAGGVFVRVSKVGEDQAHATLRFAVSDTGIGIPEGSLRRIFEPYHQGDASIRSRGSGSGLGLAIAKSLVEAMEGEIGVKSQPGSGSEFWFIVRLGRPTDRAVGAAAAQAAAGQRVLLAMASVPMGRMLALMVEAAGHQLEQVPNGAQALETLAREDAANRPVALMITDARLPDMDGLDLLKRAMGTEGRRDLRAILLANLSDQIRAEDLVFANAAGLLLKPVRQSELVALIARLANEPPTGATRRPERRPSLGAASGAARLLVAKPVRVLVAEDDDLCRQVALGFLAALGCPARAVANGKDALDAVARERFDVVLLDCVMPVMDGLEAAVQLRRWEAEEKTSAHARLYIIAMTAAPQERDKCFMAGMDDQLSKPVRLHDLHAALERAGDCQGAEADSGGTRPPSLTVELAVPQAPDETVAHELAALFLHGAESRLKEMEQAVAVGDPVTLWRAAHNLGGSAQTYRAERIAWLCRELEREGQSGSLQAAPPLLALVREELRAQPRTPDLVGLQPLGPTA